MQLDLDTDDFTYRKWANLQSCKPGDWIVYNRGHTYTVNHESFAQTYEKVSPGLYKKSAPIWAEVAYLDLGESADTERLNRKLERMNVPVWMQESRKQQGDSLRDVLRQYAEIMAKAPG